MKRDWLRERASPFLTCYDERCSWRKRCRNHPGDDRSVVAKHRTSRVDSSSHWWPIHRTVSWTFVDHSNGQIVTSKIRPSPDAATIPLQSANVIVCTKSRAWPARSKWFLWRINMERNHSSVPVMIMRCWNSASPHTPTACSMTNRWAFPAPLAGLIKTSTGLSRLFVTISTREKQTTSHPRSVRIEDSLLGSCRRRYIAWTTARCHRVTSDKLLWKSSYFP